VVLVNKEADLTIGAEFDPLGIGVVSIADRDLGSDLSGVIFITMGSEGKLKLLISLL
jgi:hypothetical protein